MLCIFLVTIHRKIQFFSASNPLPTIHGLGTALNLLKTPGVTCDASYFGAENVSFTWSINGKPLTTNEVEKDQYADNSANFKTTLDYKLTPLDDQMNLTCSLIVENGVIGYHEKGTSAIVNLYCEYIW